MDMSIINWSTLRMCCFLFIFYFHLPLFYLLVPQNALQSHFIFKIWGGGGSMSPDCDGVDMQCVSGTVLPMYGSQQDIFAPKF